MPSPTQGQTWPTSSVPAEFQPAPYPAQSTSTTHLHLLPFARLAFAAISFSA